MRSRRNIELLLLLASAPAVLLSFALLHGAQRAELSWVDLVVPAGLLLAFLGAHMAVRFLAPQADPALLPIAALLSGIGLMFVERLDRTLAGAQVLWLFGGVGVMVVTLLIVPSLERLGRYKYTIMLVGLLMLLLPAVAGKEVNGAKLWLRFGGFSFQPAELAKILIVLFLAAYLSENREVLSVATRRVAGVWLPAARHLGPVIAMWAVSLVVLVAEKDLGSSLLFFGVFLVMVYAATGRPAYVLVGLAMFAVGAVAAFMLFHHVQTRVAIWLHPFAQAQGNGYQLVQSLFSFAAGGMTGTGIGRGLPTRIPFVATDFIFSAIGEELGLLGATALVVAYLAFCLRGLTTAVRARSDMAAFTAAGLVAVFGLQTFVIVGGVTRLIPLTGITLPFVSYGGSSVLANFVLLALLMRCGDASPTGEGELVSTGKTGVLGRLALARRMRTVASGMVLLMAALVLNLTFLMVFEAPALAANPYNTRRVAEEMRQERGAILTADDVPLAESVASGDEFRRRYPSGTLASHLVGYADIRLGKSGLESAMDGVLSGTRSLNTAQDVIDAAVGRPVAGDDVKLTIDSRVQRAAQNALSGHRGAVVVLEPKTGRVLALASSPTYSPADVDTKWRSLSQASNAPLLDRAISALYPPGSTFKTVTLTGAFATNVATPETVFPGPARLEIGNGAVTNFEGGSFGNITLSKATASSVNTVFAQLAVKLGAQNLVGQANRFGFGQRPPFELPTKISLMPDPGVMTTWETAWAGVGQPVGEHKDSPAGPQATPMQMALVAAGIANGGTVMRPYVVDQVIDHSGGVVTQTKARTWTIATDAGTAATVRDLMVEVVKNGSGARAAISGVTVAGKTGTAEAGKNVATHAWFIGFAPAEDPKVAIAIVLENAGVGGRAAAPAARPVLQAALAATAGDR